MVEWKPVRLEEGSTYATSQDGSNKVTFARLTTRELKLEVQLKPGFSGGILKWKVAGPTDK